MAALTAAPASLQWPTGRCSSRGSSDRWTAYLARLARNRAQIARELGKRWRYMDSRELNGGRGDASSDGLSLDCILVRRRSSCAVCRALDCNLIPALPSSRIMPRIPSPRGGRPEACRLAGWVRRLRARVAPRSREASGTDLGTLRSLREELARPRRLTPARQKRGPEF
jgi:hypothetical protein